MTLQMPKNTFSFNLQNYSSGSFTFDVTENLMYKCNAPNNRSGVYIIYSLQNLNKELIYIGCSGHITNEGIMSVRSTGKGGLKGRIVNGHQFKDNRYRSWPNQMKIENIDSLEVHWFVTHNEIDCDSPLFVETNLLHEFYKVHKRLPRWNQKL